MAYSVWVYTLVSVVVVSLVSLSAILFLSLHKTLLHRVLLFLVSFAVGALIADPFLHLLPQALEGGMSPLRFGAIAVGGVLVFFILDKVLRTGHKHMLPHQHAHAVKPYVWINLVGDGIHNFLDGVLIAGTYLISVPLGVTTTLAVIIHEGAQELGDYAVLVKGGLSKTKALYFNFLTALTAVFGGVLTLLLGSRIESLALMLVPFTFASFLYIALASLLPEMHHEETPGKLALQILGVVLGVLVMVALLFLE